MDSFIKDNSIKVVRFVDCDINRVYASAIKSNILFMEDNKMKKWNAAGIEELNIAETANGFFWTFKECCIITNDNLSDICDCDGNHTEEEGDKGDNSVQETLS